MERPRYLAKLLPLPYEFSGVFVFYVGDHSRAATRATARTTSSLATSKGSVCFWYNLTRT